MKAPALPREIAGHGVLQLSRRWLIRAGGDHAGVLHPRGMQPRLALLVSACSLLLACGGDPDPALDASADAQSLDAPPDATALDAAPDAAIVCGEDVYGMHHVLAATPSPDGEGWCCERGYPTCDCGYFGGFVRDRCSCGYPNGIDANPFGDCDLAPPDWISETDAHGCMLWRPASPAILCCNCEPVPDDAGVDDAG